MKAERKTSIAETAKWFAIGKATIVRWMHRSEAASSEKHLNREYGSIKKDGADLDNYVNNPKTH